MNSLRSLLVLAERALCVGAGLLGLLGAMPSIAHTAPKLNSLYDFVPADYPDIGNFELSPLLQASDGDLYGVSAYGGANDVGYVYKVSRSTGQLTHLHDFGFSDGALPRGALIQGSDGALYGTTQSGGRHESDYCVAGQFYNEAGCGTLFRITLRGHFSKLHDFYSADDGYQTSPSTGVVQGSDGNFYGMAMNGFPNGTTSLFKMTPDGTVSVAHLFPADGSEGYVAYGGLLKASDGYFYGTTSSGGAVAGNAMGGCGTIFKAGTDGSFQVLHVFTGSASGIGDGCLPWSTLTQARDGNFYGTTNSGGYQKNNCIVDGCGTVFKMTPDGVETILHRFTGTAVDGEYPQGDGLVQTPDGSLYGATGGNPYGVAFVPLCFASSGTAACGTVFKIEPSGKFKQVAVFGDTDGNEGFFPHASLILASDGNLYGNTFGGGGWGGGTVYRLLLDAATPIVEIDNFTPTGGPAGTGVIVNGIGFTGASQLTFGGGATTLPASFTIDSDSQITTQVPVGADSSAIGVTAPRGTTYSPAVFSVQPQIEATMAHGGPERNMAPVRCARTATDGQAAIAASCGTSLSTRSH